MKRLRVIPWLLGITVIVGSVAGARLLNPAEGSATPAPKAAAAPSSSEGLVAKGNCVSDPPVVSYSLPAHLQAGTIVEVFVTSGSTVKVGNPLIRYNDDLLKKELAKAEYGYNTTLQDFNKAAAALKIHGTQVKLAQLAVKEAQQLHDKANSALELAKKTFNEAFDVFLKSNPEKASERVQREKDNAEVMLATAKVDSSENLVTKAKLELELAENSKESLQAISDQAAYHTKLVEEDVKKAKQAIADCTLTAKAAGTIEQLTAAVGQTVYPQSKPLLFLVPSGKRIVIAEIVPDFAYKIKGREGQKVVISDDSHTSLTYEGVVKRISDAFLPKPGSASDLVTGKTNAVLNVEIEVTDANPAGKPPLRVGQPVRVSFP